MVSTPQGNNTDPGWRYHVVGRQRRFRVGFEKPGWSGHTDGAAAEAMGVGVDHRSGIVEVAEGRSGHQGCTRIVCRTMGSCNNARGLVPFDGS